MVWNTKKHESTVTARAHGPDMHHLQYLRTRANLGDSLQIMVNDHNIKIVYRNRERSFQTDLQYAGSQIRRRFHEQLQEGSGLFFVKLPMYGVRSDLYLPQ